MLPVRFLKVPPTTYVLHYRRGTLLREGAGLAFFYYAPVSTIVAVPMASQDVPFVFTETTADFQPVAVQGQLTFRVADPRKLAAMLDFSADPALGGGVRYRSDDPTKLAERLVQTTQVLMRDAVQAMTLAEAITSSEAIARDVLPRLAASTAVTMLGLEILGLALSGVTPSKEMARALEAEAREALQRRADEAIYARRNAAVEQERRIRESELSTEIAVEEKKRQIRETQMAGEIAVEEQRTALIDRRVENEKKDADARAYALRATLEPLKGADWKTLMAVGAGGSDPKLMIALAFRELAENAGKIGELNVTPDLLRSLLSPPDRRSA